MSVEGGLQSWEGLLPNVHLESASREQLEAANAGRVFLCSSSTEERGSSTANLQQGTAAWHAARRHHITGSQLADLLGFSCPAANRVLVRQQVYHRVAGQDAGYAKLLHVIGGLRADAGGTAAAAAAAPPPPMEPFGQLACTWGQEHEAAAHHTLLQHAPPGSLLVDSGFVSPPLQDDSCAETQAWYAAVLAASPANAAIGSRGELSVEDVRALRLGCSLDGLLLVPRRPDGSSSSSSAPPTLDPAIIKRAPPYTWAAKAGFDVLACEIKCPTPFWTSARAPWVWGMASRDRNKPYLAMRAGHFCQAQLSMFVTGTEVCLYTVWSRGRCWIVHVPINRAWLHTCLHLLLQIQRCYVEPSSFAPPPRNLFWDPAALPAEDAQLSALYRRFVERTALLAASISSRALPDPLAWPRQQPPADVSPQQQQQPDACAALAQQLEQLHLRPEALRSVFVVAAAAAGNSAAPQQQSPASPAGQPPLPAVTVTPPPGWHSSSSGRPVAQWMLNEVCSSGAAASTDGSSNGSSADEVLRVYGCLVKSVPLPHRLQQPLQQDRWFLDRLDPDAPAQQGAFGAAAAWLQHPLLEVLCEHPRGVEELLQRVHMSLPPLPLAAPAAAVQSRPASSSGSSDAAPLATARGLSPGTLVLALLFKMEKRSGLNLAAVWKQLPPSALEVLAVWRQAAARRAAAASHAAANGALPCGAAAGGTPSVCSQQAPASASAGCVQQEPEADSLAAGAAAAGGGSSSSCGVDEHTHAALAQVQQAATVRALRLWHRLRQRRPQRQQQQGAGGRFGLLRILRRPRQHALKKPARVKQPAKRMRRHALLRCVAAAADGSSSDDEGDENACFSPAAGSVSSLTTTSGDSSSSDGDEDGSGGGGSSTGSALAGGLSQMPIQLSASRLLARRGASAGTDGVRQDAPEQQQQRRRRLKQQLARRVVAAAHQQQDAAKLARYAAAVRDWPLADMLSEVAGLQVERRPLRQPLHELLDAELRAQGFEGSELQPARPPRVARPSAAAAAPGSSRSRGGAAVGGGRGAPRRARSTQQTEGAAAAVQQQQQPGSKQPAAKATAPRRRSQPRRQQQQQEEVPQTPQHAQPAATAVGAADGAPAGSSCPSPCASPDAVRRAAVAAAAGGSPGQQQSPAGAASTFMMVGPAAVAAHLRDAA